MIARYIVLVSIVISVAAMACTSSGPVPALTQTPEIDIAKRLLSRSQLPCREACQWRADGR